MAKNELYDKLKDICLNLGVSLFGIADIVELKSEFLLSHETLQGLDSAVSIGYCINQKILQDIQDKPTRIYYHHYRQVNLLLDQMAIKAASYIQEHGYQALPIPASQIVDWEKQIGHLSHKKVAQRAGLGWRGRNNLLVNNRYGAQIRLATILTNIPSVIYSQPFEEDCGSCRSCIRMCPANAIKEKPQDFDFVACYEKLRSFRKLGYTDQYICGICIKACNVQNRHI